MDAGNVWKEFAELFLDDIAPLTKNKHVFLIYLKIFNTLKNYIYLTGNLSKELKNSIEILVGQRVFKLWIKNSQNIVLINNSRTAWPT